MCLNSGEQVSSVTVTAYLNLFQGFVILYDVRNQASFEKASFHAANWTKEVGLNMILFWFHKGNVNNSYTLFRSYITSNILERFCFND